ncbi:MAG: DUF2804 domain-containing protein, partial [Leptospiraceae bacterium]|nr:DUF2804 domain-containing protein [Leptospiraceae bacterium]
ITSEVLLCDRKGNLNPRAVGWARHPYHVCNLSGSFLRKKKWDYWCVTGDRFLFSATIASVDYSAVAFVYFLEYESRRFQEQTVMIPLGRGLRMTERVIGSTEFEKDGLLLAFRPGTESLQIICKSDNFGGQKLDVDIQIDRPAVLESLNVVVPWSKRRYQFTSKQHCLPAEGQVRWGADTFHFEKQSTFATLDYGRGKWPFRTAWNWAALATRTSAGDTLGINMGARWTDGTGMNENGIIYNGKLFKIFDEIDFAYDPEDFMRPWHLKTHSSDAIDLRFEPFFDRCAVTNLILLKTSVHQMIGRYIGTVRVGGRQRIAIQNVPGWAEEHYARW